MWGASGKSAVDQERRALEERVGLAEARAAALDGRASILLNRFEDASQKFVAARAAVEPLQMRARETGQAARAGRFEIVLAELRDAERLSRAGDASAETVAERAVQALLSLGSPR